MLCWGSANQLGNICQPSGKVTGSQYLGWMSTRLLVPSPSRSTVKSPLGPYRPCRHNHLIATIGSQKLALIYTEPWDGLRLSVHQPVSASCLKTYRGGPQTNAIDSDGPGLGSLIGLQRCPAGVPPDVWPADWSVNSSRPMCVPEFNFGIHFWEACVNKNDGQSQDPRQGLRLEGKQNWYLDFFPQLL